MGDKGRFLFLIFLSCSLLRPRIPPPHSVDGGILFQVYAPSARFVTLAGDFNGWGGTVYGKYDPNIDRMYDDGTHGDRVAGDGIWSLLKKLPPGIYQYKFVIDGTRWILDPSNPEVGEKGGYTNSVLRVE